MAGIRSFLIFKLSTVAGALFLTIFAVAAFADDVETCRKESGGVALAACTRAIKSGRYTGNDLAKLYNNRGIEHRDKDRAITDYTEAIRLDPKDATFYINRGAAYESKRQYDRAIADYNKAILLDPQNALAFNNRGSAYVGKGQYDRAIADYNKAIQLDPKDANAFYNRGTVYNSKRQYDRAIADLNEALRHDATLTKAYINLGAAHWNAGRKGEAIANYRKALLLEPSEKTATEGLRRLGAKAF